MKKLLISIVFLFSAVCIFAQSQGRLQSYCNRFKVSDGIKISKVGTIVRDSTFFNESVVTVPNLYLFKDNGDWVLFNCGNCCILCPNKTNVIEYDDRLRIIVELEGGSITNDYYY